MEEGHEQERWAGYVDWRNRAALRGKHGGMLAASFVLVVEVMENMAFLANASNLVTYLEGFMHLSPSDSATTVTNFMGTAFLLALLGGFITDAFFTTFHVYLISALLEFMGLVLLTVQARSPGLMPPACRDASTKCEAVSGDKAAMLFAGLYLTALGVGGIKGSLPAHGAEQFEADSPQGRKARSTFFNYYVFCLSCGGLVAVTLVVWVEDNVGWQWGFTIATVAILLSIPVFLAGSSTYRNKIPSGSPLITIAKVLVGAMLNTNHNPRNAVADMVLTSPRTGKRQEQAEEENTKINGTIRESESANGDGDHLKWLDRAVARKPFHSAVACTAVEVADVKIVLKLLPIFLSTIMLSCCLAQLSTFSIQQAATMNTRVGALTIPPASLPVFPILSIMLLAPLYNHTVLPLARRVTKNEVGVTHLQRIGFGLAMSVMAMAVAGLVEAKRKWVARDAGGGAAALPMSFFWLAFQYLFLGTADLFTLAGMLEFFFSEAPAGMRSLATALSWASLAMGYYLSSVVVVVVNHVTGGGGRTAWLSGDSLNHSHLERFYWLMCTMSAINFLHYLFWASRYTYRSNGRDS